MPKNQHTREFMRHGHRVTLTVTWDVSLNDGKKYKVLEAFAEDRETGHRRLIQQDLCRHLRGLSVEEYKSSPKRGLFHWVTYTEVLKMMLLPEPGEFNPFIVV